MPQPCRIIRTSAIFAFSFLLLPLLAHAGTWVAFQSSYTRGTGSPVTVTNTFALLNPATQYTLKAFNGGLENTSTEMVSSSVVYLNGAQVLGPSNFNQNVTEVDVAIFPQLSNTLSVQVRGQPGGVLMIQVIGVDNDPPTITASLRPAPNAAGWNNSPATVTFTCSDKTSGVASCPLPVTVSTEGANQVVPGTATDLAGNTASTSVTINLDMTPPTITAAISPPPDAAGYNSGPVTVTFTCSDALSGVASCPAPVSVTTEGTTSVPASAIDVAGNIATITVTVNISFNYFKIQSWQTGPAGNAKSPSGKCLDYGTSPSGNGATVFLNDCSQAHSIRVVELNPRAGSGGATLSHEVLLFAGNSVIGIHNPPANTLGGPPPPPPTEFALELQYPFTYLRGSILSNPADQIFRLDGDSIILEGAYADPSTGATVPGPCINTSGTIPPLCPDPPPLLVIQIQNARGANGSPLVAGVRSLADNEFWDFNALDGSGKYPTAGFISAVGSPPAPITTNWQLWNALCADMPQATLTTAPAGTCSNFNVAWGSVVVIAGSDPNECAGSSIPAGVGPCLDLSLYPVARIPAGVTIRGNRRGTISGPQLFASYASRSWILEIVGDYARVTGLRLRGQSRSTDKLPFKTNAIWVDYAGSATSPPGQSPQTPQIPYFSLATVTELIATIDHNNMSDWMDAAINVDAPFSVSSQKSNRCLYTGYIDPSASPQNTYTCDPNTETVPYSPSLNLSPVTVSDGSGTLSNTRVSHNFLHHNERNEGGYGVGMNNAGGRALIDGNTFSWNRHDITGSGEPHSEYRASHNLVLSGAYASYGFAGLNGREQDFDMHGTDNIDNTLGSLYWGGVGGYHVVIDGNTFLGGDGHDYVLRGYPFFSSDYHNNVSRRNENDAIHFIHCFGLGCINDYTASDFPITISNSQFGQSTPDPASTLRVGDFDGDGDDDLFLATGNTWFYSPGGQREWRYLNSAPDTIDQLLLGDFDGDGRTDVVAMRNGQLVVSWGGISGFDVLNYGPLPCTSMADMAVGDFDGDGKPDVFCADGTTWWISYGGNTPFVQVIVEDFTRVKDLRFGDFNGDGTTDVFGVVNGRFTGPQWQVRYGPKGFQGVLGGWQPLPVSLTSNPASVDGLVVADFDGNGIADVGMPCSSGGVLGVGASPGWQISHGGAQGWSNCNAFAGPLNGANCALIGSGLNSSPCVTLASGAVGRFSGGPGADILLWNYYNSQGAASLWDFPGGTGTPYQLSAPDVDAH